MNNEGKTWAICTVLILVGMVIIISIISYHDYEEARLYVTHGYEQVMLPGSSDVRWRKIKR